MPFKMIHPSPQRDSVALVSAFQIADQLNYAEAIWEMLEAGPWSAEAGAHLNDLLGDLDAETQQFGCRALHLALVDVRCRLTGYTWRHGAPAAEATAIRTRLAYAVAIGRMLNDRARCDLCEPAAADPACAGCRRA